MDWISTVNTALALVKKYRYALLAVVIGIILMSVPEGKTGNKTENMIPIEEKKIQLEESLAEILSEIDGVGNVRVLLTTSQGEETVYQMDENISSGERNDNQRSDTVIITGDGRAQTGLVRQVIPPVYLGALVVCQGASDPKVRLWIVDAVMRVTGLTSDKITVLKMK